MPDRLRGLSIRRVAFVGKDAADNPLATIEIAKSRAPSREPSRRERLDAAVKRTAKAQGRKVTTTKEDTMGTSTFSKAATDAASTLASLAKEERTRQASLGRDVTTEQAVALILRESPVAKRAHAVLRDEGLDGSNAFAKAIANH